MSHDDRIQQFISYIAARGIPDQYHELYRQELIAIMLLSGATKIETLDQISLGAAVRDAEQKLQNRRAVAVAIERFLRHEAQRGASNRPPSPGGGGVDDDPDSFDWTNSPAVHPPGTQHRKYVRVPFNGEISIDGMKSHDRASDISLGGMYIETVQYHEVGNTVTVSFKLHPSERAPLTLLGRVVYYDPGIGAGIDFITVPKEARDAIRGYIEHVVLQQR